MQVVTAVQPRDVCPQSGLCVCVSHGWRCTNDVVLVLFQLLGVNGAVLTEALTHKKIIAKGEEVGLDTQSDCGTRTRCTALHNVLLSVSCLLRCSVIHCVTSCSVVSSVKLA